MRAARPPPFASRARTLPIPISLPPSPTPTVVTRPARTNSSSIPAFHSDTSAPRMLRYVPSRARPGRALATRCVGRSLASRRRAASSPSGQAMTSAASPSAVSAALNTGAVTASVTYRTSAPSARNARPSTAAPGGPSVSAAPESTTKPVVTRTRRARRNASAARRAPPGWKNFAMPRAPGSRARRWSTGSGPRSGKALALVAGWRPAMQRVLLLFALAVLAEGCSTAPIFRKQSFDFKTTALFKLPCDTPEVLEAKREIPDDGLETSDNQCNSVHMLRMVDRFMSIQEADEAKGIRGDTFTEVRAKGFSIFTDPQGRKRRPNTKPLYGNDALAAVGMGVAPPPLQKAEDIKAYTDFMAAHYGEEYEERDIKQVVDRFCLNRRDSHELGDARTFSIVWRNGHVFKRIIKGGPINNPKQERAFLVCPGEFIIETVKGVGSRAAGALLVVP